jgi:hypothetical protein
MNDKINNEVIDHNIVSIQFSLPGVIIITKEGTSSSERKLTH